MTYNKKLTVLSGIIAGLVIIYILTIIFDPERRGARSAAYSWLEPSQINMISGITIANNNETITLARNGGKWFVSHDGKDYPARALRIDDFIAALTKRASYPVRSSSVSSHERLSLADNQASRIVVAAGVGQPLLSLMIGQPDVTGQNVYLRKQGQNEVRSGEDIFSSYLNAALASWYNLRLFPESEDGRLDASNVQRLTVYPPSEGGTPVPQIFTRRGREWTFNFELVKPDMAAVDNYIRDILNTSGDDFVSFVTASDPMFNNSRIVFDLGDGSLRTVRLSPPDENGRHFAAVSGSDFVYSLPNWTAQRLFAVPENFEAE